MKFKTRIRITFAIIIILPLVLTSIAFYAIGMYVSNVQKDIPLEQFDFFAMSESMNKVVESAEVTYGILQKQISEDASRLEDKEYLKEINSGLKTRYSYILVRKGEDIYFAGKGKAATELLPQLPAYGWGEIPGDFSLYNDSFDRYIKQLDFVFSDGDQGSVFVVTKEVALVYRNLLVDMFVAIIAILIFTGLILTRWIRKGVFFPVTQLNVAMKRIQDGDFSYSLQTEVGGEIGELYRNYEDMRLRLKESAEEKEENKRINREFISNISHDLKTPITVIKGYVEGIMAGVADSPEKREKYLRTVYSKTQDMERLINELAYYSKVDSNKIPYNFHRINVAEYFDDCVEEVGVDLEQRGIELNYSNLVDQDTIVIADPEQMKKVINNIISNSVKYMDKPKGVIDIRILDATDSVRIEIEDNGKGVAQKDLSRIFERFYRTDTSRNSAQGGSGIGLSIVKRIIEDHGGYIWATGKEGEGICIHFVLRKYIEISSEK